MRESIEADEPWPVLAPLLALVGLVTGLLAHLLLGTDFARHLSDVEIGALGFVMVSASLLGFTLERRLWPLALVFALAGGAIAGLVLYWNGGSNGWGSSEGWRTVSLALALTIAAPLFQSARDAGAIRFPYAAVHDHAWTNVVLWCACWLFVGIVFALAWLLAALFQLIDIRFLADLLGKPWFYRALVGLAFGAALGRLRERDRVVRLLQRVVATVLSVLAPVLGLGLLIFLLALPFTGLQALWDATRSTTPILLSCIIGALILANAVIGDVPEHESRAPALRWGAAALAAVMLPLAILAAIATGLRIDQYGFTPDRLWALTFDIFATAYGLAYLVSLARGRLVWARFARPANLHLAFAICVAALVLATPLVSFNAISTRDQLARLASGMVSPEKFDWAALAFDFGDPGRGALKQFQGSRNPILAKRATEVLKANSRWNVPDFGEAQKAHERLPRQLRILPAPRPLPADLTELLARPDLCGGEGMRCTLLFLPGDSEALLLRDGCFETLPAPPSTGKGIAPIVFDNGGCVDPTHLARTDGKWGVAFPNSVQRLGDADRRTIQQAFKRGTVEVRSVPRRQLFVGGVPVGQPFE